MISRCPAFDFKCPDFKNVLIFKVSHNYRVNTCCHGLQVHYKECRKRPLSCPSDECHQEIAGLQEVNSMKRHLDTCKFYKMPCKFRKLGCNLAAAETNGEGHATHEHHDDGGEGIVKHHLSLLLENMAAMKEEWETSVLDHHLAAIFKVTRFQERKEQNTQQTFTFYTSSNRGYKLEMEVYPNGHGDFKDTHLSVFLRVLEGKHDQELEWPFLMRNVRVSMLNQLKDANHHCVDEASAVGVCEEVLSGGCWGFPRFAPQGVLTAASGGSGDEEGKEVGYLKDNTLYFKVKVELSDHKSWLE